MNMTEYLHGAARACPKRALPILSFPAAKRLGVTVSEMLRSADLQAQAMQTVALETPTLAAVSPMDLSVEAEAFGAQVRFIDDGIPAVIGTLVTSADEAEALQAPAVGAARTGVCLSAVSKAKSLIADRPVLAGVIGPYSLAGRLCDVTEVLYLCYDEPELVHTVLYKATEFITAYCLAFRQAGADGVVLAEPLAGLLSPDMCAEFSCPYVKRIIDAVQTDEFAVVYHNCGNSTDKLISQLYAMGAAAYHFGNAVDMRRVLDLAPADMLCMGNIDPVSQFADGTPQSVAEATRALMLACGSEPNFIPSSGCDIPPSGKWDNINAFFDALTGEV